MPKSQMIIRLDPEIKSKLSRMAKAEGKNSSEVIRELISSYVQKHDMSSYIDDLWSRIGHALRQRKVTESHVSEAIREYRENK